MDIFKTKRESVTKVKAGRNFSHQEWQGRCDTCGAEYKADKARVNNKYEDEEYGWTTIINCDCGSEVFMHLAFVEN